MLLLVAATGATTADAASVGFTFAAATENCIVVDAAVAAPSDDVAAASGSGAC